MKFRNDQNIEVVGSSLYEGSVVYNLFFQSVQCRVTFGSK